MVKATRPDSHPYATSPFPLRTMPPGIPFIIANEAAERFSYYGMRSILIVFMTRFLADAAGSPAPMTEENARAWYHVFSTAVYFCPLFGALLADVFLGKYRTIMLLSTVYCLGHLALALDETRTGLAIGLSLIAIGSGGIKPCVSAHVGDQFGPDNEHLLSRVFAWFYFSINIGALISSLLTPILLESYGPRLAFGLPGALMLCATIIFYSGRRRFVHIPAGGREFLRELKDRDTLKLLGTLAVLYVFIAPFWSLFEQTASAWVLQAARLDLEVAGLTFYPAQIQAVNPVLVLLFIPFFSYGVYPLLARWFDPGPLRRIALGLALAAAPFFLLGWLQDRIDAGERPTILWHVGAYALITAAEVLVSITTLEFAYTQAKPKLKSLVMIYYLGSISLGNLFTAAVNFLIQNEDGTGKLAGSDYYYFFALVMSVTALVFLFAMRFYRERRYIQGADSAPPAL